MKNSKVDYTPKFEVEDTVKTTVYMSEDDIGEEIKVGTKGIVVTEPVDDEQLVGIVIGGTLHYLPQDVLEVV
jgi:hypothetical protein